MNNKISSGEVLAITTAVMLGLFPGLANFLILSTSRNASILSILISFIAGLIPIFIIMFISKKIKSENLFDFLINKFKGFGYVLNIILILGAIFIIFITSWLFTDFVISQFLTRNSYYPIALCFVLLAIFSVSHGLEVFSRSIFILFIFSMIVLTVLWGFLTPYVDLNNLKPYIDVGPVRILKSSFMIITLVCAPSIYILNLKNKVTDKKNFERKILVSYIIILILIFFIITFFLAVYGIDIANIATYPAYAVFKKIEVLGFVERIENFAAIVLVTMHYAQFTFFLYYLKDTFNSMIKIKNKKKINILVYLLSCIITIVSIYLFKSYNLISFIHFAPFIISFIFIIIIIIFIRCLFIKKTS